MSCIALDQHNLTLNSQMNSQKPALPLPWGCSSFSAKPFSDPQRCDSSSLSWCLAEIVLYFLCTAAKRLLISWN